MAAHEQVELLSGNPPLRLDDRRVRPSKRPSGIRLIPAIDAQRVVGTCPTIMRSLAAISRVLVRARIHEQPPAIANQVDAQSIGMPVPWPVRSCVNCELLPGRSLCHQVEAAVA